MTTLLLKVRSFADSDIIDTSRPDIAIFTLYGEVIHEEPEASDCRKVIRTHRIRFKESFPYAVDYHQFCKFHRDVQKWADKACKQLGFVLCKVPSSVINFETQKNAGFQEGLRMINAFNLMSVIGLTICTTPMKDLRIERVEATTVCKENSVHFTLDE